MTVVAKDLPAEIARKNRKWTADEDATALAMRAEGALLAQIASATHRTRKGVADRLKRLRRDAKV
jgi:hypothetical protein